MTEFDKDYYKRFYRNPRTRVAAVEDTRKLGHLVLSFADHHHLPVNSMLDMGCGVGHWRQAMQVLRPRVKYHGVEFSEYLCSEFGWEQGSVATYRSEKTYDLVVCQGVLQYLDDAGAERGIRNLARLTEGLLFLEALTKEDWRSHVDRQRTDGAVHLRPAAWYRERIFKSFIPLGGGVFVRKGAPAVLFSLEEMA
jgi:2-polyprenyl-3-methyl-5-hydroxy-6-metoxy-1,4-benzoquinol methylase